MFEIESRLIHAIKHQTQVRFEATIAAPLRNQPDLGTVLGKVLRIDPLGNNSANGNYGIVASNPFAGDGDPSSLGEIYSYGHRNPWRMTIDQTTGRIVVGEVGHFNIEEVNLIVSGGNYGWPLLEGSFLINFDNGDDLSEDIGDTFAMNNGLTPPVFEYDHQDGASVTGGFVYRGSKIPAIAGKYIFAELQNGPRLFAGELETGNFEQLQISAGSVDLGQPVSFGEDADGELYVVTIDGRVLTIEPIAIFGDVNQDGVVNLLDVQPFIDLLNSGGFEAEGDINQDGVVNLLDVGPFITVLGG